MEVEVSGRRLRFAGYWGHHHNCDWHAKLAHHELGKYIQFAKTSCFIHCGAFLIIYISCADRSNLLCYTNPTV